MGPAATDRVTLALLRGVCQMPAYSALAQGFFRAQGLAVDVSIAPTAWTIPDRMLQGEVDFAVIPWTRVAAASAAGEPLVLVCGSGCEEAAVVVRAGVPADGVRRVAVPQEGGMKDLTAAGLVDSLGWRGVETLRLPSGDAAIVSFVGAGADAVSVVEPYATMLERTGHGRVVRRTGDLWPGVPGCSLATTRTLITQRPGLVQRMVTAFVAGARFVAAEPARAAADGAGRIGVAAETVACALGHNAPDVDALRRTAVMDDVVTLMLRLGYLPRRPPAALADLRFLDAAATSDAA